DETIINLNDEDRYHKPNDESSEIRNHYPKNLKTENKSPFIRPKLKNRNLINLPEETSKKKTYLYS
ncbi:45667_t:CDS:1, partial [Gigaspora margarita]